ncbi:MAG: CrcB family protein [Actinomycetota bacterium]|nr:CrcB family protein [Actinomycetota bacterium]
MPRLLLIALGGILGSSARYGVALAMGEHPVDAWPWATFLVNVVGALAIGIVAIQLVDQPALRPFVITGILGGFTTFSALAVEAGSMLDAGRPGWALAYVAATVAAGLLAVRAGMAIGRQR